MKKKLVMIAAFCLSMCVVSVKANESGDLFTTIGQSHLPGVTVAPFKTGDTTINVNLDPYGYVYGSVTSSNGNKIKKPENKTYEIPCSILEKQDNPNCEGRKWTVSGNRADGGGNYTVQLEKPLAEGDKVTLSFADDGNFYFGQLTFESQKSQNERLQKEREAEEKQYAEELFKRSIEEETNKTWYQRWGDSIQDQWWNFKSWWQG
ncbi:hypothetical protein [Streptococcus canis]|uniref:hypothetical protein n=1 Tax=Streptococcus canis TaxID=1329 RepID=UPI0012F01061|nr:hypothetical protein [Streptococcus canis]GFE43026.1 hypothetical protein ScFU1_07070 [Streptococcus canis]